MKLHPLHLGSAASSPAAQAQPAVSEASAVAEFSTRRRHAPDAASLDIMRQQQVRLCLDSVSVSVLATLAVQRYLCRPLTCFSGHGVFVRACADTLHCCLPCLQPACRLLLRQP